MATPTVPETEPTWLLPSVALSGRRHVGGTVVEDTASEALLLRHGFRIGRLGLLVDRQRSGEYLGEPAVFPMPNTAEWFAGLLNLRGSLVPVFDLGQVLELARGAQPARGVLILDKGENALALRVEGPPRSFHPGPALAQPPPLDSVLRPYVRAAYQAQEQLWLDLDVPALILALTERIPARPSADAETTSTT